MVHHAIPDICVFRPAGRETLRLSKVLAVSPLHSAAPQRCMPAQAERVSCMISVSPSLARPSWIILLLRNNRHH